MLITVFYYFIIFQLLLYNASSSNCACFHILFSVPIGTSILGLPETVTVPSLSGCLNCR